MRSSLRHEPKSFCAIPLAFFLIFTLSVLLFFSFFSQLPQQAQILEDEVGVDVGVRVRLVQTKDGVPAGMSGIVILSTDSPQEKLFVYIVNYVRRGLLLCNVTDVHIVQEVPNPLAMRRADMNSEWPYWKIIRSDHWYTQRRCMGALFCENEHKCLEGVSAFQRCTIRLHQNENKALFEYEPAMIATQMPMLFRRYMQVLMSQESHRLYYINIIFHHAFLIEQSGQQFRIYQSWRQSFDLQYWVNPNNHQLCEPGYDMSKQLLDPVQRKQHLSYGRTDDTQNIEIAKHRYGCLRSLTLDDVMQLCRDIAVGFELADQKMRLGGQSIMPASVARGLGAFNTERFLGKSAIKLTSIVHADRPPDFAIEVNFIEFLS